MIQVRYVSVILVDPEALAAAEAAAGEAVDPRSAPYRWTWRDTPDEATAEALRRRNDGFAGRLLAALPELERQTADYAAVNDWQMEEGLDEARALARMRRWVLLAEGQPPRALGIEVTDGLVTVSTNLWETSPAADTHARQERFESAVRGAAAITGFRPWDPATATTLDPADAGALATRLIAAPAAELRRKASRSWVGFVFVNLIIAAVIAGMFWAAAERGRLIGAVDPDRPLTFIVHGQKPVTHTLWVFPDLDLAGVIRETGQPVTLDVFRDEWIAAQRGSQILVFATGQPDEPFISVNDYSSSLPLARLGPLVVTWPALLGSGALALWGGWLGLGYARQPALRRAAIRAGFARSGLKLFGVIAVVLGLFAARRLVF